MRCILTLFCRTHRRDVVVLLEKKKNWAQLSTCKIRILVRYKVNEFAPVYCEVGLEWERNFNLREVRALQAIVVSRVCSYSDHY